VNSANPSPCDFLFLRFVFGCCVMKERHRIETFSKCEFFY